MISNILRRFSLRMFDNTNVTTDTGLSVEMKTFYEKQLIRFAQPNLVHEQVCEKKPLPANKGKVIEFRYFDPLPKALAPLTEGVTPSGRKLSVNSLTAEVYQYGDYVEISDIASLTTIDPLLTETVTLQGQQAGKTRDTIIRNYLQAGTNVLFAPKVSGGSETEVVARYGLDADCKLTWDVIEKAVAIMKANNVPTFEDGFYHAIVHPYVVYDLRRNPEWIDAHKYADNTPLLNGEIGRIAGVRFLESSEAKVYAGADLASDARNLNLSANASATTTISFNGGTVAQNALKDRYILIGTNYRKVVSNTTNSITVDSAVTATSGAVIAPGEGGAGGISVFGTLLCGKNSSAVTDLEGGGLQYFVEGFGSAGSADPLHQRQTAGWKMTSCAEVLVQAYIMRIESASKFTAVAEN